MTRSSPIEQLLTHLRRSLADNSFVSLQLSRAALADTGIQRVEVRLIHLRGQPHLSFTSHGVRKHSISPSRRTEGPVAATSVRDPLTHCSSQAQATPEAGQVVTKNFPEEDGIRRIGQMLATEFRNALLRTTRRDWQLHCPAKGSPRLVGHKASTSIPPSREHDQPRNTLLNELAADWLQALGISDPAGRIRPSMTDKHRQISRYVEILFHLARECGWTDAARAGASVLQLADMGCGKGYLTFAAWHLFQRTLHRTVSVLGVETRSELVNGANDVARQMQAEGLEFIRGDIASVHLPDLDALIALHACDTATDDAICRGVGLKAKLIVVAPCCHQALRPELGNPEPLGAILRHGLFKERMAEWLTDGLRTLYLEWAGYQAKVIEFVGSEHTSKNLMIAAVRKRKPFMDDAAAERILELKRFFGIQHHALDDLLEGVGRVSV